jgi:hypothetical protein
MTKKFFAFCLVAGVSFVLYANAAVADDTSKDAKPAAKAPVVSEDTTAGDVKTVASCERRHVRRLPKLRIPRFELPEFKLPKLNCPLRNKVETEQVDDTTEVGGRVVFDRTVTHAGHVRNVKYIKIPGRFLLKRIVTTGDEADVEP